MTDGDQDFPLTIGLETLEHLGMKLYSSVPAVLSETVANAWDADADTVEIQWNETEGTFVVKDDGSGMTPDDIRKRYLHVGYKRRIGQPGPTPLKERAPMGRKGIGKLSLFSIAKIVDIETRKEGVATALRMNLEDIQAAIEEAQERGEPATYQADVMPADGIDFEHGTRITLRELHREPRLAFLKRRLARRFSVIGPQNQFEVKVDGQPITPADRGYYDKIQYLWTYGDQRELISQCPHIDQREDRTNAGSGSLVTMTGWLATVKESGSLKDDAEDNLNRIAVFVRGKVAQEDILSDFSERGVYASYLIGELYVDSFDQFDGEGEQDEDVATSSRERLVEGDPRYIALRGILRAELKHIQGRWTELRTEEGAKRALEIPEVDKWLTGLSVRDQSKAKRWLGRLNRLRIDSIEEQRSLLKHTVLGFEAYRTNARLRDLEDIDDANIPAVLEIIGELDAIEAHHYWEIIRGRLAIVTELETKVNENAFEELLQQCLFDHPWLLDPSWERAAYAVDTERPVRDVITDINASLSEEERKGRLDILYRLTTGQHVIVELKRPRVRVHVHDLIEKQIEKYYHGVRRELRQLGRSEAAIEIIIVLGREPFGWDDSERRQMYVRNLAEYRARVVLYKELVANAKAAYQEYLSFNAARSRLSDVMRAIDDYAPEASGSYDEVG